VCANADRTVVAPAGGLRYIGLKSQYMYLAGLLDKIGVKVDGVRIGAHKSAPEEFMNEHASDTARADYDDLLRQREAVFVRDVANGRHLSEDRVRAETLKGPFIGGEAKDAGFVDGLAFDDEVERATDDLVGFATPYLKYEDDNLAPTAFGPQPKIAILYVDGDITDGRSAHIPLLGMNLVGSYTMVDQIKQLRDDPTVRAVVMRIDSPGGSSDASEVMWRELQLLADKKPLIVSMGTVAASGGYYIAAPAQKIFALPLTVTGSIGIFYIKPDLSGLLEKLGVNIETYKTTPHADADSLYRPFTVEERGELQKKVQQFYEVFLDRVSRGRHMSKEAVDAVGQGRVWTGQEAIQHHLVDEMGGLRHALEYARTLTGLPEDVAIAEYPPVVTTLLDWALSVVGVSHAQAGLGTTEVLPAQILKLLRAVAPAAVYGPDVPLARMEYVPVDE
jgi:protease-4